MCRAHTHVLPAESGAAIAELSSLPEADVEMGRLRDRVRSLELELRHFRDVDKALRESASEQRHAARDQLLASEARFHHLIDAVTDYAIFMLDPTGHVATWNPGAKRIKGYGADEIVGKDFSIFYTPEDRAAGKPARILETLRRDGRFEDEGWRVRKDGTRFWASVVITALREASGELVGFAKVTRDLTSRREAEERERALVKEQLARTAAEEERARLLKPLEIVAEALQSFGAKVTAAKSAHDALEERGPFDVIVSDIGMPGMDGYTLMRTIRSREAEADVPAIALTAFARDVDAERALRAGYQQHFSKPIDARKLVDAVKMWARAPRAATQS